MMVSTTAAVIDAANPVSRNRIIDSGLGDTLGVVANARTRSAYTHQGATAAASSATGLSNTPRVVVRTRTVASSPTASRHQCSRGTNQNVASRRPAGRNQWELESRKSPAHAKP